MQISKNLYLTAQMMEGPGHRSIAASPSEEKSEGQEAEKKLRKQMILLPITIIKIIHLSISLEFKYEKMKA